MLTLKMKFKIGAISNSLTTVKLMSMVHIGLALENDSKI